MLGSPPRPPLPIDLAFGQSISPRLRYFRNWSELEQAGESKPSSPETALLAASVSASNNDPETVQALKNKQVSWTGADRRALGAGCFALLPGDMAIVSAERVSGCLQSRRQESA